MHVRGVRYNANADTLGAKCTIVERALRNKVEFRVAHRYGISVNARGPIRGELALSRLFASPVLPLRSGIPSFTYAAATSCLHLRARYRRE